jgi:hypothetical protein
VTVLRVLRANRAFKVFRVSKGIRETRVLLVPRVR